MGDLAGQNLGPYRILDQIGAGGMATVYKAYHAAMDRYVAIKVLPEHLARDPNFRARFQREARTIARLEHRYILPVHDVGEEAGIPYFVMRYTDGGDLGDLIAKKSLSVARAAAITAQVAEALAYAHRQGIIHRDIKPANILIGRDGEPLLTDFGIAKIYEDTLQLTGEGVMVGTPTYMAPEQLQGQPVDPRTDIYALGVVLYQSLTGEPPFVAETPLAVMLMHIHNPLRPPRQRNPAIPEAVERIILRAMAKDPADRFQTAGEMAEELRQALNSLSRPTSVIALPPSDDRQAAAAPMVPTAAASTPASSTPAAGAPVVAPIPVSSTPAAGAPVVAPAPAARRRVSPIWLGAGVAAITVVVLAALLLRGTPAQGDPPATGQSGGTAAPTAAGPAPGPTIVPRANMTVLTSPAVVFDLAVLGDTAWAATAGGLARYSADGKARVFTTVDGLPFNGMSSILAAPDGTIWIGSSGRVARVRPVADGLGEVRSFADKEGMDIGDVYTFMADTDGSIWAGGSNGVRHFDGTKWMPPSLPADDPAFKDLNPEVHTLLRDRSGAAWIGLSEGLLRWDGKRWTRFDDARGVGKIQINRLIQDQAGTIWAAAGGAGLLRYDAAQDRWQKVVVLSDGEDIHSIVQLAGGRLWASSADGIAASDDGGAHWTAIKAPERYAGWAGPGVVVQDSAGRLWVAAGAGVSCCADSQWHEVEQPAMLPTTRIGRLAQAPDGKLWAVEQYGGSVAAIDPATVKVEPLADLDARSYAVAFTHDTTWIGTSAGVIRRRSGATLRLTTADGLPSDSIHQLLATDTTLWIGTDKGLAFYDLATDKLAGTVSELDGGIVEVLFRASNGEIWAGSQRVNDVGLVALGRYDGKAWQVWRAGDAPLPEGSAGVTAISADTQGHVWVAVWNGGVHTWDGASWKNWVEADGAPSSNVLALAPRDGEMWLGGGEGNVGRLFRWSKDGWSHVAVDGMTSQTNDMRFTADGALWIATSDGLLRISKEGVAALR
jgi:ligand-binding sensor domain-containing protein/tRNA A-37 threonylcarbamoyl transferase component Bud32